MARCAGLDWGGGEHGVCVVDRADGQILARFMATHDAAGLATLVTRLAGLAVPAELPIAIERPSGLLVETLVAAGHPVVPIHPNIVKASRPRYCAAGSKSDLGDAYLLADLLRTDGHRFRPLTPCADETKALQALVRGRDDLVAQRLALANQLRALLNDFWPGAGAGAGAVFADIDSPIALAFMQRYPTPDSAARLGEKRMAAFLAEHRYPGGRSAAELMARLHAAPLGRAGKAEAEAKGELVQALASSLVTILSHIAALTRRIERAVTALPDGRIIMSFPRAGRLCAAQILAELGSVRERFPSEEQLAVEAGVCPVTRQSGKNRSVVFRWACNHRLRKAITCFADNSRHASAWAADLYRQARTRGCHHAKAIRILARAWIRVLWRAWTDQTLYDPQKHKAACKFDKTAEA